MPFTLDPEIKTILEGLFQWAGESYKEGIRGLGPDQYVAFDIEEPEVLKVYPKLKDYFLGSSFPRELLQLDAISDDTKTKPPWPPEQKLERAIEDLLLWAGISMHNTLGKNKVGSFMTSFENGFNSPPSVITYLPIFGLSIESQMEKFTEFNLCKYLDLIYLEAPLYEFLKKETYHPSDPHLKNILPSIALRIDIPMGEKKDGVAEEIRAAIAYFKVMMMGFFNLNAATPIEYSGRKTQWKPLDTTSVLYRGLPKRTDYKCLRDQELKVFKKYWPLLYPKTLKRYHITGNRLASSENRTEWTDKVIDISIALESLIESETELSYRLSNTVAWLTCEKIEDREAKQKKIKNFYNLRSKIVHGRTFESLDNRLQEIFKKLISPEGLSEMKRDVQQSLLVLLLNQDLQTSEGQNQLLLGLKGNVMRHPT